MTLLKRIETIGNRLPDPAMLFLIALGIVMICSQLAVSMQWTVSSPYTEVLTANSLLSSAGIWWLLSHMVENFILFPPLGIVLVGMLGIGLAERSGLMSALLQFIIRRTPASLLTPVTILLGIMSSLGLDAGYVVLPPVAAALYLAAGRSPLTGIAAVFAGISAGFSANLLITALDPLLSGFTQTAAQIIAPDYQVAVTANWWFMIASTFVLTLTAWAVTAVYVDPVLQQYTITATTNNRTETGHDMEIAGLKVAGLTFIIAITIVLFMIYVPKAPLFGEGNRFARWIEVTVPLLFLVFLLPGIAYGYCVGSVKNNRDVARMMGESMAALGPYIVLAFFAAQFIEAFKYSGLGEMLAISGGQFLAGIALPSTLLLSSFVLMVIMVNLLIGSASAKYAFIAPVFVPMLMQVGFSPELTQAAYRVGDSVSNVVTPLNPYMIIIVIQVQKYLNNSGIGTVVSMMLPYFIAFSLVWSALLVLWFLCGIPLGPEGPLHFNFT